MSFSIKAGFDDDGDETHPNSEINVTPFVDVMLVLLIVFMVTAPMLAQGIKVDLPKASSAAAVDRTREPLILGLSDDGQVFIGPDAVAPATLDGVLRQKFTENNDVTAHIRAGKTVAYGRVLAAMDALGRAGITRIAFIAQPGAAASETPAADEAPAATP